VTEVRTAKSCGPDISTLISSWRRCFGIASVTVTRKPDHRGEHEAAVKTVAQETPDDPALPVVTCSCAFFFAREAAGAARHPAFPAPSSSEGFTSHYPGAIRVAAMRARVRCSSCPA